MLMFAGGGVIQQWPFLLQLMVSSVKPVLLEDKDYLLHGQDQEEADAEKQIGDWEVYLEIVSLHYFFDLLIGLGKQVQEAGCHKDSSTEASTGAQSIPPQRS